MNNEQIVEALKTIAESQKALTDIVLSMQTDISDLKSTKDTDSDEKELEGYGPQELTEEECLEIARNL